MRELKGLQKVIDDASRRSRSSGRGTKRFGKSIRSCLENKVESLKSCTKEFRCHQH